MVGHIHKGYIILAIVISGYHPGIIPMTPSMLRPPLCNQSVFSVYGDNLINNLGGIFR